MRLNFTIINGMKCHVLEKGDRWFQMSNFQCLQILVAFCCGTKIVFQVSLLITDVAEFYNNAILLVPVLSRKNSIHK